MKCKCCGQEMPEQASERFHEFKAIYPRRKDFKKAEKTWKRRKLDAIADTILAHVRHSIDNDSGWNNGFVPLPTTYLNGDRWEDEIDIIRPETTLPTKNDDWETLGRSHGITPGVGESWPSFKDRVKRATGE